MSATISLTPANAKSKANPRTLCLQTDGAVLEASGGHFVLRMSEDARPIKLPTIAIRQIILERNARARSSALKLAMQSGIPVSFFGQCGEFLGHTQPPLPPSVDLRMAQYRAHGDARVRLALAKRILQCKIESCHRLLQSRMDGANRKAIRPVILSLEHTHRGISSSASFEILRGMEGAAARAYFGALATLLPGDFGFSGRNRQPPADPANALLSYGYSVLLRDIAGKLEIAGLDPYVGCLHETGYGSAALALDLAEPLRALAIDHVVLGLASQHGRDSFEVVSGRVRIGPRLKQAFFEAYEARIGIRNRTQSSIPGGSLLADVVEHFSNHLRTNTLTRWKALPESCLNHLSCAT